MGVLSFVVDGEYVFRDRDMIMRVACLRNIHSVGPRLNTNDDSENQIDLATCPWLPIASRSEPDWQHVSGPVG